MARLRQPAGEVGRPRCERRRDGEGRIIVPAKCVMMVQIHWKNLMDECSQNLENDCDAGNAIAAVAVVCLFIAKRNASRAQLFRGAFHCLCSGAVLSQIYVWHKVDNNRCIKKKFEGKDVEDHEIFFMCSQFIAWISVSIVCVSGAWFEVIYNPITCFCWILKILLEIPHLQYKLTVLKTMASFMDIISFCTATTFGLFVIVAAVVSQSGNRRKVNSIEAPLILNDEKAECEITNIVKDHNLWELLTFKFVNPMMDIGITRQLDFTDLLELPAELKATSCYDRLLSSWTAEYQNHRDKSSLLRAMSHSNVWTYLRLGLLKVTNDSISFVSPLLLNKFIKFLQQDSQYSFRLAKLKLMLRSSIMGIVYRKCLCLSLAERSRFSEGEIQNFMSVDADRTINLCNSLHDAWSLPLQIGVALYLLYTQVNYAFLSGLAITIILIPVNKWISTRIASATEKMMKQKDRRISCAGEVLAHIRTVKMYNWEKLFTERLVERRESEVKHLAVFTCVALFNTLISPLNSFPWFINGMIDAVISSRRLSNYLSTPEHNSLELTASADILKNQFKRYTEDVCCSWSSSSVAETSIVLRDISLQLQKGLFIAIVGENSDVYLFDDILSAVDSQVASWILEKAIMGPQLMQKTGLLSTHNLQVEAEARKEGRVELSVYKKYAAFAGWSIVVLIFLSAFLMQASRNGNDLWLTYWVDSSTSTNNMVFYLIILAMFGIINSLFTLGRAFSFAFGGLRAAIHTHASLLENIISAPVCFFDQNPSGRILNRLSSDLYTIDDSLPFILNIFVANFFSLLDTLVVLSYSQVSFLLILLPLWLIYRKLQFYYRSTSREVRRLDSVARSPIYSSFTEMLDGSSTIRAFQKEKTSYSELIASLWLSLRLQLLAGFIILFIAMVATVSFNSSSLVNFGTPGLVGLALSYAAPVVSLLNGFLTTFTETEKEMVSVERIAEYVGIAQEELKGSESPPRNWPTAGKIEFVHVTLRYKPELPPALNDVSFLIAPGMQVGIIGRTGAGKSSVLNALFRLVPICNGRILVDGIDVAKVAIRELRAHFAVVPQSPFLFDGSLRENLDPFNTTTDIRVWEVLEKCHMKGDIESIGGLDIHVKESGASFSVGQRQLLCLARAILKSSKVLCLDECTANVDNQTAFLLQNTISAECKGMMVLTIAHRISTVMKMDNILVLDQGKLVEEGNPEVLMTHKSSRFARFAKASQT
ncbi:ABC transporter C family member 13 isoform X2 [Panicum miliaceum]|uniref:ABC transporter C family member 13 isoform X2 n=1 Tax=Panicum miliaceum TaxID=4540 RepID=A0A3L6RZB8_PANMI|nr:ABC transporter C family member 13 isoform X2 [Panicum miliaceum]